MKLWWTFGLMLFAGTAHAAAREDGYDPEYTTAGDLLQFGIPLAGLGLTLLWSDDRSPGLGGAWTGGAHLNPDWYRMNGSRRHDWALAFARMEAVTYGLKYSVDATRPNGGGQSFPSGHTAAAFMGAEFVRKEYGWAWAAPAYLTAAFVGWTRVESDSHYPRDVYAGAAIGILSNHDWTELHGPWGTLSLGLAPALTLSGADSGELSSTERPARPPPWTPLLSIQLHFGGSP